jgi:heptosyltransferase III
MERGGFAGRFNVGYIIKLHTSQPLSEPRRILVIRTDRLGDVILTLPMVSVLREWYPTAHIAMMLNRYTGAIVNGHPALDDIIWDDGLNDADLLKSLRVEEFDTVFVVHPTPRLAWLVMRAGIPTRIGSGYRYYGVLFNHRVFEHRKDARHHELEYNLHMLRVLRPDFVGDNVVPRYGVRIDPDAHERVRTQLGAAGGKRLVVLHPGSGGSAHDWPPEHFRELARLIAAEPGYILAVTGGPNEKDLVQSVAAAGQTGLAFCGTLSLPELAALYADARVVVGNSTGPLHLAAAVGTPVVGLYPQITAMSPARWGPYTDRKRVFVPLRPADCRECEGGKPCTCMASIAVHEVWKAVREQADE